MNVYFVRHGQSQGNKKHIHQSSSSPLTKLGIKQARQLGERFKQIKIDSIVCSDYLRTQQTAEQIANHLGLKLEYSSLFRERKRPTCLEGKRIDDPVVVDIKNALANHAQDPNWHYQDEENFNDLILRAQQAQKFLEKQRVNDLLIVSHGEFIRTVVGVMLFQELFTLKLRSKGLHHWQTNNTGITWLKKTEDFWSLVTWNDHAHLG